MLDRNAAAKRDLSLSKFCGVVFGIVSGSFTLTLVLQLSTTWSTTIFPFNKYFCCLTGQR